MKRKINDRLQKRRIKLALALVIFMGMVIAFKRSDERPEKHIILISLDSVYEGDFDRLWRMPVIQELVGNGAYSNEVTTVYPTLTYTIHTSILTGTYPDAHGIYHNQPLQPGTAAKQREWFWYAEDIKRDTLYDLFANENFSIANILWPVTGKNVNIDYNLPAISDNEEDSHVLKLLKAGTPSYLIKAYVKHGKLLNKGAQPQLDQFSTAVAVDTIKNKQPNFLTLHLLGVDSLRHKYGVHAKEVDEVFAQYEASLVEVVQATKDAGIFEDTLFVITTDHGQIDVHQNVYLNNVLKEAGYITELESGELEYEAYAQSIGLGALIYIKDHDPKIKADVRALLVETMKDENYGIDCIYSDEELAELHASKEYDLAIEAVPGYQFKSNFNEEDYESGIVAANHGYSPFKPNYKTIFIISGPEIMSQHNIGSMNIVDIAPTLLDLMGLKALGMDGTSLKNKIVRLE